MASHTLLVDAKAQGGVLVASLRARHVPDAAVSHGAGQSGARESIGPERSRRDLLGFPAPALIAGIDVALIPRQRDLEAALGARLVVGPQTSDALVGRARLRHVDSRATPGDVLLRTRAGRGKARVVVERHESRIRRARAVEGDVHPRSAVKVHGRCVGVVRQIRI